MSAASARGLFRATGNEAKPVAVRDLLTGEIVKVDSLPREADEFYPTPPEPTRAFLAAELPRLMDFHTIWEPAAGDSAMCRELQAVGLTVFGSDIIDRGAGAHIQNFYDFTDGEGMAIVTNPPFAECNWRDGKGRWVRHALDRLGAPYMALLMSWTWPGAAGLGKLWADHTPARVYLMRWKIDFTGQGSPPMLNGWFVWDGRTAEGDTRLIMLDRADARQGDLLEGGANHA